MLESTHPKARFVCLECRWAKTAALRTSERLQADEWPSNGMSCTVTRVPMQPGLHPSRRGGDAGNVIPPKETDHPALSQRHKEADHIHHPLLFNPLSSFSLLSKVPLEAAGHLSIFLLLSSLYQVTQTLFCYRSLYRYIARQTAPRHPKTYQSKPLVNSTGKLGRHCTACRSLLEGQLASDASLKEPRPSVLTRYALVSRFLLTLSVFLKAAVWHSR